MRDQVLLVQPPYGELYDIPFSTIATLTAALRGAGYTVIPRDLNVDFMHVILNEAGGRRICDTMAQKIEELDPATPEGKRQTKQLTVLLNGLRKKIPDLDAIYETFTREVGDNSVQPATYKKVNNAYIGELLAMAMLSRPRTEGWTFFDRVENEQDNLYYDYFETLFRDTPWDEIALVGITVTFYSQMPGFSLANWIRRRYPHVHVVMGGDRFSQVDLDDAGDLEECGEVLRRYAHSIVFFEGDTAIVRIMDALAGRGDLEAVPNRVYLKDGAVARNLPVAIEKSG
ncbi:MAG: hypothetical protein JW951_07475 [Lentisphaerae bacterium]|nr:hypothetical protein [Lentisphaerota bacterium]